MVIENKAREAERIVSQLVDEAERRKEEARELQREVASARYIRNKIIPHYYTIKIDIEGIQPMITFHFLSITEIRKDSPKIN